VTNIADSSDRTAMLGGFLDWFRGVAEHKLEGLTLDEATKATVPSGTTMLGIINHLAWAERLWFGHYLLGELHEAVDVDESFHLGSRDTVASVIERYRTDCARSRHIVEAVPSLDARSSVPHRVYGPVTLEWILVHMIEETARHSGHLDIIRELTDGQTGD
jgi:uncharacterized damage-inducible protein DinB